MFMWFLIFLWVLIILFLLYKLVFKNKYYQIASNTATFYNMIKHNTNRYVDWVDFRETLNEKQIIFLSWVCDIGAYIKRWQLNLENIMSILDNKNTLEDFIEVLIYMIIAVDMWKEKAIQLSQNKNRFIKNQIKKWIIDASEFSNHYDKIIINFIHTEDVQNYLYLLADN